MGCVIVGPILTQDEAPRSDKETTLLPSQETYHDKQTEDGFYTH